MGVWGINTFDNDTAGDWSYGLEECDDLSYVRQTLENSISSGEVLDADIASEALAACEVIARLSGNWGERNAYTETVDDWVKGHPQEAPVGLIALATRVIDSVLREDSELRQLWEQSDEFEEWRECVADLNRRLGTA